MRFAAIDVECATSDFGNICEIGLVVFDGDQEISQYRSRVRPVIEEFGDWQRWNLPYGLRDLLKAPRFGEVWAEIAERLQGIPVVAHNASTVECRHFSAAFKAAGLEASEMPHMYCSLELARRLWPEMPKHGLKQLAREFKWSLDHHNPLSDARLSAFVVQKGLENHTSIAELFAAFKLPACKIDPARASDLLKKSAQTRPASTSRPSRNGGMPEVISWSRTIEPPEALYPGQFYVLSGFSPDEKQALRDLAGTCGFHNMSMVTPKTDFLVAHDQMGPAKYARCKKYGIPILTEEEFRERVAGLV